jgi:hypothetical protein
VQPGRALTPGSVRDYAFCVLKVKKEIPVQLIMWVAGLALFLIAQTLRITVDLACTPISRQL